MPGCRRSSAEPGRHSTPASPPTCSPPGISGRGAAAEYLARLLAEQPPVRRYERKKLTDREVLDMIPSRLAQAPAMPASRLLREFRDAGYACEQQRFAQLYRTVTGARQ